MPGQFPQDITQPFDIPFTIENFGLYALKIIARCQSADLRIEIDGAKLREIPPQDRCQYNNIPPTWNGTELKGLNKTIVFILVLNKGLHTLTCVPTNGARIEFFEVKPIKNIRNIVFEENKQAEEGDRRPWYTFAFVNLPLQSLTVDISVSWHFLDGDDVKLIIDNKIEENLQSKRWKYWIWSARPWFILSGAKREQKTFVRKLSTGIHYIEFWADKTPTLHKISFNLGDFELRRIPTIQDPIWTGDFNDDTDAILLARLILGEMEGQSEKAKAGAGFTVVNRLLKKKSNWGYSLKEVILKESQYDAFVNEKTLSKVQDPLNYVSKEEWESCYKIADQILSGVYSDPTSGATHFYSTSTGTSFPWWATPDVFRIKIGITYFYELES